MNNPAVFVFLNEKYDLREIIAGIQTNEGGFNLNRVNIYAVAGAAAFDSANAAGRQIREAFYDEFSAVDLTLAVAVGRESCDAARRFLFAKKPSPFDRIFIISDKNEHGEILPGAEKRIDEIIAALPLLHKTGSRFNDALAARCTGDFVLASAGFWQKPPLLYEGNRELYRLAGVIEREILANSTSLTLPETTRCAVPEEITKNILAIAAKPLRFWELPRRTVKEAETLLYSGLAEKFFEKKFPPEKITAENYAEKLPLCEGVAMEKKLRETLVETEIAVKILENEMERTAAAILRPWEPVQNAKIKIGEYYALRYELQTLRAAHEKYAAEQSMLATALDELRATLGRIKKLPQTEPPCELRESEMLARGEKLAPVAISLLRDDGLLRESHIVKNPRGENCLLRVVGGFSPWDLHKNF